MITPQHLPFPNDGNAGKNIQLRDNFAASIDRPAFQAWLPFPASALFYFAGENRDSITARTASITSSEVASVSPRSSAIFFALASTSVRNSLTTLSSADTAQPASFAIICLSVFIESKEILGGVEVIDVNGGLNNGLDLRVHFASCGLAAWPGLKSALT